MSIGPIGFSEPQQHQGRRRARIERQEAKNYLAQLKIESVALKLCADYNFALMANDMAKNCEDPRARASWAKIVADITRLGKRDKSETAGNQPAININILMDPDRAARILANLEHDPIEMSPRMRRKLGMDKAVLGDASPIDLPIDDDDRA